MLIVLVDGNDEVSLYNSKFFSESITRESFLLVQSGSDLVSLHNSFIENQRMEKAKICRRV